MRLEGCTSARAAIAATVSRAIWSGSAMANSAIWRRRLDSVLCWAEISSFSSSKVCFGCICRDPVTNGCRAHSPLQRKFSQDGMFGTQLLGPRQTLGEQPLGDHALQTPERLVVDAQFRTARHGLSE